MNDPFWHEQPNTVLLDTAKSDDENHQSLLFTDPKEILQAFDPTDVPELLTALDGLIRDGWYAAGYLDYECGEAFESVRDESHPAPSPSNRPIAWFGIYPHAEHVSVPSLLETSSRDPAPVALKDVRFSLDRATYRERFTDIKNHIREGDVYQINFTGHLRFEHAGAPIDLYRRLRRSQRVPYGAFVRTDYESILCFSPELFFRREGSQITARPMKGTIRRGRTLAEDERLREELSSDPKSQAENLMIVDLLRNDLSRVSRPDTVRVPRLFETHTYDTVTQMTSTVESELLEETSYQDLFRAIFPCGSVTGAPKVRAMQIINRLEPEPREVYCGAIGYISPDERATFNVAIRTVQLDGRRGRMGTGSGIVWDSDADLEYDECALKTQFLTEERPSFYLIETMKWAGEYFRLERHLDRLWRSARHFDFSFERENLLAQLRSLAAGLDPHSSYKIRISLYETGRVDISHQEISPNEDEVWTIGIGDHRIDPDNRFRYHKTSRRSTYDELHERAAAEGCDEIIFLNTRGEICEGSRSNIFIKRADGLHTPPVSSGLLPGVYRSYMLDTFEDAHETVLYPEDLERAEEIYLCNSVREVHRARLVESPTGEVV